MKAALSRLVARRTGLLPGSAALVAPGPVSGCWVCGRPGRAVDSSRMRSPVRWQRWVQPWVTVFVCHCPVCDVLWSVLEDGGAPGPFAPAFPAQPWHIDHGSTHAVSPA